MVEEMREIAVQVGGKLKTTVTVRNDASDDEMLQAALADEKIKKIVEGKEIVRTITVKNKLINIIVR